MSSGVGLQLAGILLNMMVVCRAFLGCGGDQQNSTESLILAQDERWRRA